MLVTGLHSTRIPKLKHKNAYMHKRTNAYTPICMHATHTDRQTHTHTHTQKNTHTRRKSEAPTRSQRHTQYILANNHSVCKHTDTPQSNGLEVHQCERVPHAQKEPCVMKTCTCECVSICIYIHTYTHIQGKKNGKCIRKHMGIYMYIYVHITIYIHIPPHIFVSIYIYT